MRIAALPTPLREMENLSRELGVRVLRQADTVLFVHTGGLPELFNFADELRRGQSATVAPVTGPC